MNPEAVRLAFVAACEAELSALKPGNVGVHAAGHGMTVGDFRLSAQVASWPLCRVGAGLGARVLGAVEATRAAVGQNTNLGIVLLCGPLAMAAERAGGGLGETLRAVLDEAGDADAAAVFRAIVLAAPGGLGRAAEHDVREPPRAGLDAAMAAAAGRDRIAAEWIGRFAGILGEGLAVLRAGLARWGEGEAAAERVFLHFLAGGEDSHVLRRHGAAAAAALQDEAATMLARYEADGPAGTRAALLRWDAALKQRGVNPGTSADLTVATLFACRVEDGLRQAGDDGSLRAMPGPQNLV